MPESFQFLMVLRSRPVRSAISLRVRVVSGLCVAGLPPDIGAVMWGDRRARSGAPQSPPPAALNLGATAFTWGRAAQIEADNRPRESATGLHMWPEMRLAPTRCGGQGVNLAILL